MGKSFMKTTVITCTGDREICLNLLTKWMDCQTMKPERWLIVDDGKTPISQEIMDMFPKFVEYIRREPVVGEPQFTLNLNMLKALSNVKEEKIIFWEDDEYYAPRYIETISKNLDSFDAVGVGKSRYYYLPSFKYYVHNNMDHASLAQTAINYNLIDKLIEFSSGNDPFIDIKIWQYVFASSLKKNLIDDNINNQFLYVGMKGMPGRSGIGSGHRGIGRFDSHQLMLKKWIPLTMHHDIYLKIGMELNTPERSRTFYRLMEGITGG